MFQFFSCKRRLILGYINKGASTKYVISEGIWGKSAKNRTVIFGYRREDEPKFGWPSWEKKD